MPGEGQAVKYTVKDSVFTSLFREKKYLMQLYRTLHPEDEETTEEGLTDITIKNVLVNGMYNDLGFMAGNKLLILVEAQATWTANIIVRALLYLSQTYQEYLETRGADLYGSGKVELPRPELYVIYTGERPDRPDSVRLTEEFFGGEESAIEVEVKMLYGDESWEEAGERDIISQYVAFTKVYNEQRKLYARTKKTIMETIRICKDRNLLKEYLESREREVKDIMFTLFDQERAIEIHVANVAREAAEKAAKEAAEKAAKEAEKKAAKEAQKAAKEAQKAAKEAAEKAAKETEKATIEKMMKKGKMTAEEIADYCTNFSLEEIRQMEKDFARTMK